MIKIENLLKGSQGLTPKEKIFNYLNQKIDEIFAYSYNEDFDKSLQTVVPTLKPGSIDSIFFELENEGRISKFSIGRRVYLGSIAAVQEARKELAKEDKPKE